MTVQDGGRRAPPKAAATAHSDTRWGDPSAIPAWPARPRYARLAPLRIARTSALDISYYQRGSSEGAPVLLLHGYPYDIHSFVDVIPMLVDRGLKVFVPYLRGHGSTRFRDPRAPRSGQQAALGTDVVELMDALGIAGAILAGFDWGGRAACVAAALWPHRCTGLVSVNGYLIQSIAAMGEPLDPRSEVSSWYCFYFATERGRAGLRAHRREIAEIIWARNSPMWTMDPTMARRVAGSFDNPDHVDVVVHGCRHGLGLVPGCKRYEELERRLADQPVITVPTITLDGLADGNTPPTDGARSAVRFADRRAHRQIADAGHNLPLEAPADLAAAVLELVER